MNGYEYESFCAEYLQSLGFYNVEVTKSSGDQGVDITGYKNGEKYAVQCKYYNSPVGNKAVQEIYSGKAFYGCQRAVVITNNTFTPHAIELANKLNVELWNSIRPVKYDMYGDDGTVSYRDYCWKHTDSIYRDSSPAELYEAFHIFESMFRKGLLLVEDTFVNVKPDRNRIQDWKDVITSGLGIVFSTDELDGMFCVQSDYKSGRFQAIFARETNDFISDNLLMRIQNHYNCTSLKSEILIERIDAISIRLLLTKKPSKYDFSGTKAKYLFFRNGVKGEELQRVTLRSVTDGNRSRILFDEFVLGVTSYLNYYLYFIAKNNAGIQINPTYLMEDYSLEAVTYNVNDGFVWLYYRFELNNRARYDSSYAMCFDNMNNIQKSLIVKARVHVCDYIVHDNTVSFKRYPEIFYSYEYYNMFASSVSPEMNWGRPDLLYIYRHYFVTAYDDDVI